MASGKAKSSLALVELDDEPLPAMVEDDALVGPLDDPDDDSSVYPYNQADDDTEDEAPEQVDEKPIVTRNGLPVYSVPQEGEFDTLFLDAPDLSDIAHKLIYESEDGKHNHLQGIEIDYLWKKKGGQRNGKAVLGRTSVASPLIKHYSGGEIEYVIWVAADHVKNSHFTDEQVEALVYHELCHIEWDEDRERTIMVGHDFEGFLSELEKYGTWDATFERMVKSAVTVNERQLAFDLEDEE